MDMSRTLTRNQEKHSHDGFAMIRLRYISFVPHVGQGTFEANNKRPLHISHISSANNGSRLQYHIFRTILPFGSIR